MADFNTGATVRDSSNSTEFEPVQGRYDREWLELLDDRKVRGYDERSEERRSRDFVDPEAIAVDNDGNVTGTVGDKHDNVPSGFNVSSYEAELPYLPDRDS